MQLLIAIYDKKEKRDVWLFLDPAKEDIEKASDEIDQGEMGGDEPTDSQQSPEDGEQAETYRTDDKRRRWAKAIRDAWNPMKLPRGPGAFLSRLTELVMKVIKNRT